VQRSGPTLTRVITSAECGECVTALTLLGDDVFVLRWSVRRVQVYDAATFALRRRIETPPLGCPWGLAACARHGCFYVSDGVWSVVHRVGLSGGTAAAKKWSVVGSPRGLSVNDEHNVVVACCVANMIQEYTTHGTLVREISLQQAGVTSPWHAVKLSTDDYVVVDCELPGAVSVVGIDGQVVRGYVGSHTSDVGQMSYPRTLAVTSSDGVLVADRDNDRILSINRSLSSARVLPLPVDGGIRVPWSLCLDESRRRLYVGEGGGRYRVLVFDGVTL